MSETPQSSEHPTDRWARTVCETARPQDDTGHSLEDSAFAQLFAAETMPPDLEGRQLEAAAFTRLFGDQPHPITRDGTVMIGKYKLGKRLGGGGMGDVFLATDTQLGRPAAIKLLRTGTQHNEVERRRLLREAQALATLQDPHVVSVYDCGVHDDQVYLAMECVEGETLRDWQDHEPRPWREILACYLDAGRGLAAVHAVGLVHRDFKPQNVLRSRQGHIKIADFGLAVTPGERDAPLPGGQLPHEQLSLLAVELTASAAVLGTPLYISPEQLLRQHVDARSDQFSFCVALYEALYASHPYAEPGPPAATSQLATVSRGARGTAGTHHSGPPSMISLVTGLVEGPLRLPPKVVVSSRVFRALRRGLARDPAARFPTMQALLRELARDPLRKAAPFLAALGIGGLVVGAIFTTSMLGVCKDIDQEILTAWNPTRARAVETAFKATGSPHATAAAAHVQRTLDDYATQWTAARQAHCDEAHAHRHTAQILDRRQACLEHARSALTATVDQLILADHLTVVRAPDAIAQLPALEQCSTEFQTHQTCLDGHDDPELRAPLDHALALEIAGHYEAAESAAADVATSAAASEHNRLAAEAELIRGRVLAEQSRASDAQAAFSRAYSLAEQSDCVALSAEISTRMAKLIALNVDLPAHAGPVWSEQSDAKIKRLGSPLRLVADHLNDRALLLHHREALDPDRTHGLATAQADYEESRELREDLANDRPTPELAHSYLNLGGLAADQNHPADAVDHFKRAIALYTEVYGPEHPSLWKAHFNLGTALGQLEKMTEAREQLEIAKRILVTSQGKGHPKIAEIDITLATYLLDDDKQLAHALELALEAEGIYSASLETDSPLWLRLLTLLRTIYMYRDEPALALKYGEAVVARSTALGAVDRAEAEYHLAEILYALDRNPEALTRVKHAMTLLPSADMANDLHGDLTSLRTEILSETP